MVLKLLKKIPFLKPLGTKELNRIYRISRIHDYGPGETIFSKLESAGQMFIVLSGRIKIFSNLGGRKRKTFSYLEPGDFFGEMALLEGKTRSASAQAVVYSRLLVVGKKEFKSVLIADPHFAYHLLCKVCERLRRADAEIEDLLFRNILGRLSKVLADLSRKGREFRGGRLLHHRFTQQELADLVGTTREPLTRALSALRRGQIVELRDGRYLVKSPERLAAICRP